VVDPPLPLEGHQQQLTLPLAEPLDSDRLSELRGGKGLIETLTVGQEGLDVLGQGLVDLTMALRTSLRGPGP
jgi:hypothetical protein